MIVENKTYNFAVLLLFQLSEDYEQLYADNDSGDDVAASCQASSDQPQLCFKFVQTEQSAVLHVERMRLNEQLMKQHVRLLRKQLDKRCTEAVISATRLRELEWHLSEMQVLASRKPDSLPTQQLQHLEAEPLYKSENNISVIIIMYITVSGADCIGHGARALPPPLLQMAWQGRHHE